MSCYVIQSSFRPTATLFVFSANCSDPVEISEHVFESLVRLDKGFNFVKSLFCSPILSELLNAPFKGRVERQDRFPEHFAHNQQTRGVHERAENLQNGTELAQKMQEVIYGSVRITSSKGSIADQTYDKFCHKVRHVRKQGVEPQEVRHAPQNNPEEATEE